MTNAPTTRETADHIGEANEKVTADHAELERLAEVLFTMAGRHQETYMAAATGLRALLSQIAALQQHRDGLAKTCQSRLDDWHEAIGRATQAERQRDELQKALRTIGEMAPSTCETSLAHDMAQFASQALANQGADHD